MLTPLPAKDWSLEHAAHLLNRAGFGGTPDQIRGVHALGLDAAVGLLLTARDPRIEPPAWTKQPTLPGQEARMSMMMSGAAADSASQPDRMAALKAARREDAERLSELRSWWLRRMRHGGQPLLEKMTLFWHGHFATSVQKVNSTWMMWRQNETFREHALGDFRGMLRAVARDPAMIRWLDLNQSKAGAPNENFARELMELFTLGIGHYTEEDVKNAARAFTGHRIGPDLSFAFAARRHDHGGKVFMGRRGDFDGDAIIDIILAQPPCARFVAKRIWEFFAYENPEPATLDAAAFGFRRSGFEVSALLGDMFRSAAFYSARARRSHIKSPVEWMVQTCVALEIDLPPGRIADAGLKQLGQSLFAPPNVRGWEGGRSWISTSTLMMRYNHASQLLGGADAQKIPRRRRAAKVDVAALAPASLRARPEAFAGELTLRLYGTTQAARPRARAISAVSAYSAPATDAETRAIFQQLMNTPDYQIS